MRPQILKVIICFFLFYLVTDLFSSLAHKGELMNIIEFPRLFQQTFLNSSFFVFVVDAVLAYLTFFFFYQKRGTVVTILIFLLVTIPLMISFRYLIEEVILFHITGRHNYNPRMLTIKGYVPDNLYYAFFNSIVGVAYFAFQFEIYRKLQQKELKLQVRNAELSFLKSQINPHFLFNNLNSIYALVYQNSTNALPAISKLSELLRYTLYQKEDTVLLQKEIEYLKNFIDLQLLRYDYNPVLQINLPQSLNGNLKIIPLTLVPFVENAFKHGDLKDPEHPLTISIELQGQTLIFQVLNKKSIYQKDVSGGIGLENVKKRLELLSPGSYDLNIEETEKHFLVHLKMTLND